MKDPISSDDKIFAATDNQPAQSQQAALDLATVMSAPEGQRFILGLLRSLGVGSCVCADHASASLYNFGRDLLEDMTRADPHATVAILAALFNVRAKDNGA